MIQDLKLRLLRNTGKKSANANAFPLIKAVLELRRQKEESKAVIRNRGRKVVKVVVRIIVSAEMVVEEALMVAEDMVAAGPKVQDRVAGITTGIEMLFSRAK